MSTRTAIRVALTCGLLLGCNDGGPKLTTSLLSETFPMSAPDDDDDDDDDDASASGAPGPTDTSVGGSSSTGPAASAGSATSTGFIDTTSEPSTASGSDSSTSEPVDPSTSTTSTTGEPDTTDASTGVGSGLCQSPGCTSCIEDNCATWLDNCLADQGCTTYWECAQDHCCAGTECIFGPCHDEFADYPGSININTNIANCSLMYCSVQCWDQMP